MRHTAGIPEGLLGRTALHARYAEAVGDGMTALDGPEFVARLAALPLLTDLGTQWHCGLGFDLLGQIVESLTADTLGAFLARRLFAPLGMTDTRFGAPGPDADRFAVPSARDPLTGAPQQLPDLGHARFESGGAGLIGTGGDYLAFVRMLLAKGDSDGGRVLGTQDRRAHARRRAGTRRRHPAARTPRLAHRPRLRPRVGRPPRDGRRGTTPGSAGEVTWPGASGAFWWADPAEDLGMVFLTHAPSRLHLRHWQQIKSLVLQALR
ncbi:serine hydrolase domain-containing protein [Kitasatospora sp. CB01950]|uniref:serine hydrolase domain-containing protein n=1 Tax=Kitasatospora sp. CB01950 TaxID=1703930 RepID=UPI0009FAB110|nr:serine hydrolase domain-containing protein [Kitasatospora sp. CB01950]